MRKVLLAVLIAAVVAMVPALIRAQDQDMDYDDMMGGMGMTGMGNMCGGMGMTDGGMRYGGMMHGGMGMMGPVWRLDLTNEQRTKIRKIQDDLRKEHWAVMGKIMDEQAKLRDLYEEDTLDPKQIGAAYDVIFGLRKQMIMTGIDAMNRIRGVLTKEQQEQLKKLRYGGTGMMGRGMMGHGMGPMGR
jgi:Spy/CpxP family protein refolding chaperone